MSDNGEAFARGEGADPLASLRALARQGEMDSPRALRLRVQWLRREQPEVTVATELSHLDARLVVVRATVTLPTGAAASCLAAEDIGPDASPGVAVERAETRALSGALDRAGYTVESDVQPALQPAVEPETQASEPPERLPSPAADGDDWVSTTTPPPVSTPASSNPPTPMGEPASDRGRWSSASSSPTTPRPAPPTDDAARPQVVDALRRVRRPESPDVPERTAPTTAGAGSDHPESHRTDSRRPPITLRPRNQPNQPTQPAQRTPTTSAPEGEEAPLEDFSWSAFWKWARARGYTSHDELGRAIGRPTQNLTPGQIRTALREAGQVED